MAKQPNIHPYSDQASFERLMLLLATLVKYPGIGAGDKTERITAVQQQMQTLAAEMQVDLPWYADPPCKKTWVSCGAMACWSGRSIDMATMSAQV